MTEFASWNSRWLECEELTGRGRSGGSGLGGGSRASHGTGSENAHRAAAGSEGRGFQFVLFGSEINLGLPGRDVCCDRKMDTQNHKCRL